RLWTARGRHARYSDAHGRTPERPGPAPDPWCAELGRSVHFRNWIVRCSSRYRGHTPSRSGEGPIPLPQDFHMRARTTPLCLALLLAVPFAANAQDDDSMFSFSGFGTVGVVHNSEDHADFATDFGPDGAGHSDSW